MNFASIIFSYARTGALNTILITFSKILPTERKQYTTKSKGGACDVILMFVNYGNLSNGLSIAIFVLGVLNEKNIWVGMVFQQPMWGWSIRLAEPYPLTGRAGLFIIFMAPIVCLMLVVKSNVHVCMCKIG